jgi:outer membrane protein assembly factor BamB
MSRHFAFLLLLAGVLVGASLGSEAGQWTRFRGPNGAGLSPATTVPVEWTAADHNWRVELPGSGHSSPVIWGERIFLLCTDPRTARRMVCCLSTRDGALLWRRDYESAPYRQHQFNSYASSTPTVDAERVYSAWTAPKEVTLVAHDHAGKELWRGHLGSHKAMHGSASSPILLDGAVFLANDQQSESALFAVEAATGETRWTLRRRAGKASYVTPCIYRPAHGPPQLLLSSTASGVTGVDAKTGKVAWEVAGVFGKNRCAASPLVAAGRVVTTAGWGGKGRVALAVRPGSDATRQAQVAWRLERPAPYVPTPIAVDGLLFVWCDGGTVRCVRPATGEEVWRHKLPAKFFGSPVCLDGRLYCISMKGHVFVLAAADEFELLARMDLGEKSYATPAVADGVMYLRTFTHLISIGGR